MKKNLLTFFLVFIAATSFAKKVKFAVDMTGQTLSPNGIHVSGDFQTLAGFAGGDWNSASTTLTQEGTTDIYSIVVDIPAFAKYEYKFVNGDQFYEAEFVPEQSRVGYNFNDNRWIYVDSIANDTSFVGAILFGGNAPAGLTMVRFYVDMQNEVVSSNGVHIAGSFQNWNPGTTIMYSFGSSLYEIIGYTTTGSCNFRFYNGNTSGDGENLPGACSIFGNREVDVQYDTLLTNFCFASCVACVVGINENVVSQNITLFPNPSHGKFEVIGSKFEVGDVVKIFDVVGKEVYQIAIAQATLNLKLQTTNLKPGIYFVKVGDKTTKLILE